MEDYNGWKNRETWATALHINNDYGLQLEVEERVTNLIEQHEGDRDEVITYLSEWLQGWITDLVSAEWWRDELGCEMSEGAEMMRQDIGSLWRVEWYDIAESLSYDQLRAYEQEKVSA